MDRLVIIGIDACDWRYVMQHLEALPTLRRLIVDEGYGGRLESDVYPLHSGPCWSQLFAGTTFGLTDFARDDARARIVADSRWLWRGMEGMSFVAGVPAALPPIDVNADERGWIETTLSITEEEMQRSTWMRSAQMAGPLRRADVGLIVSVWPALDRAGHIFGMDAPETLRQYQLVDQQLDNLWVRLAGCWWVLLSDHGMTSDESYYNPAWFTKLMDGRKGRHTPDGIIATNMAGRPTKLSQVYEWLQKDHSGEADSERLG